MKNFFTVTFLLFSFALSAQEYITISHGCNFKGDENGSEYYSFDPSGEAALIVKKILDGAGALSHSSIIVKESNVKNAVATTLDNRRYILYSTVFLEKFKGDAKTKWAAYTVLAHEIGHHLNDHDFKEKAPKERKRMELEADKFAGAICRTLGATLQEALAGMESMELEGETATHPAKSARTAAVANGWKLQDEVLKSRSTGGSSEMEAAVESVSGKISQAHNNIEVVLYSAKTAAVNTTFHFLVKNKAEHNHTFRVYLGSEGASTVPASIVDFEDFFKADDIVLEGTYLSTLSGRYHDIVIGGNTTSFFKVLFKNSKLASKETVLEFRVTISVSGSAKTLAFRNIPLPYEMKK